MNKVRPQHHRQDRRRLPHHKKDLSEFAAIAVGSDVTYIQSIQQSTLGVISNHRPDPTARRDVRSEHQYSHGSRPYHQVNQKLRRFVGLRG
jgi:hypothetical protein